MAMLWGRLPSRRSRSVGRITAGLHSGRSLFFRLTKDKALGKHLSTRDWRRFGNLGAQGCVLVGEPAFYNRFGFRHDPALRMEGVPPEVLLCLPMCDEMPEGAVTHHPAFSVGE